MCSFLYFFDRCSSLSFDDPLDRSACYQQQINATSEWLWAETAGNNEQLLVQPRQQQRSRQILSSNCGVVSLHRLWNVPMIWPSVCRHSKVISLTKENAALLAQLESIQVSIWVFAFALHACKSCFNRHLLKFLRIVASVLNVTF
jgi:hypothetical protein